jgi:hypothetical protein
MSSGTLSTNISSSVYRKPCPSKDGKILEIPVHALKSHYLFPRLSKMLF